MPQADKNLTPIQQPDAADAYLAEVRQRAETMSAPDDEGDLFSFAADVARKVGMLPGTYTRRGGVGIDVWTAGSRRGQPRYRVWVERGENFNAARTDVPRLLEAVTKALAFADSLITPQPGDSPALAAAGRKLRRIIAAELLQAEASTDGN